MKFDMNNRKHMLYLTAAVLAALVIVLVPYFQAPQSPQRTIAESGEAEQIIEEDETPAAAPASKAEPLKIELPKFDFQLPKIELPKSPSAQAAQQLPKVNTTVPQPLVPGKCPSDGCRAWISGSCSKAGLYKERECYRYSAFPECKETIYYESRVEPGAC